MLTITKDTFNEITDLSIVAFLIALLMDVFLLPSSFGVSLSVAVVPGFDRFDFLKTGPFHIL
jgi:hypothetical protein